MSSAFVYDGVRTPFGKFGGGLAATRPDDLAAHVVKSLVERAPGLDPAVVDDAVLGLANGAGEDAWPFCSPACPSPCPAPR